MDALEDLIKHVDGFVASGKVFSKDKYFELKELINQLDENDSQHEKIINMWNAYKVRNNNGQMCESKMRIKYNAVLATILMIREE